MPVRLQFLLETVELEARYLTLTDGRLFARPFDEARVLALAMAVDDAEQTDAFVARFGRLQDTLGDKLVPELLRCLAEPLGAAVDNLDRVEKLGLLSSVAQWLAARKLRNLMVHEYVRDATVLARSLNEGHSTVPLLIGFAANVARYCQNRVWI